MYQIENEIILQANKNTLIVGPLAHKYYFANKCSTDSIRTFLNGASCVINEAGIVICLESDIEAAKAQMKPGLILVYTK